jgi:hypothetical protein
MAENEASGDQLIQLAPKDKREPVVCVISSLACFYTLNGKAEPTMIEEGLNNAPRFSQSRILDGGRGGHRWSLDHLGLPPLRVVLCLQAEIKCFRMEDSRCLMKLYFAQHRKNPSK